jgi:hypothetical protein
MRKFGRKCGLSQPASQPAGQAAGWPAGLAGGNGVGIPEGTSTILTGNATCWRYAQPSVSQGAYAPLQARICSWLLPSLMPRQQSCAAKLYGAPQHLAKSAASCGHGSPSEDSPCPRGWTHRSGRQCSGAGAAREAQPPARGGVHEQTCRNCKGNSTQGPSQQKPEGMQSAGVTGCITHVHCNNPCDPKLLKQ